MRRLAEVVVEPVIRLEQDRGEPFNDLVEIRNQVAEGTVSGLTDRRGRVIYRQILKDQLHGWQLISEMYLRVKRQR